MDRLVARGEFDIADEIRHRPVHVSVRHDRPLPQPRTRPRRVVGTIGFVTDSGTAAYDRCVDLPPWVAEAVGAARSVSRTRACPSRAGCRGCSRVVSAQG
ncbi:hypothetical protein GCM10027184_55440 [Saccharothrix stipae]